MGPPVVDIEFRGRLGNRLFQYSFGRLLAENCHVALVHPAIEELDLPAQGLSKPRNKVIAFQPNEPTSETRRRYQKWLVQTRLKTSVLLADYFEDYIVFRPYLERIRSWFSMPPPRADNAVAVHFRCGDVMYSVNNRKNLPSPEAWKKVLDRVVTPGTPLYIVTTCPRHPNRKTVQRALDSISGVDLDEAVAFTQKYVDVFEHYHPVGWTSNTSKEDFRFLRTFNRLVIGNSTFGWWAAVLGHAKEVHVYGPWRPMKGRRNKNLGHTDYSGWSSWGD